MQDTESRPLSCPRFGLGTTDQVLPSHRSITGSTISTPVVCEPTAKHELVAGHDTPERYSACEGSRVQELPSHRSMRAGLGPSESPTAKQDAGLEQETA